MLPSNHLQQERANGIDSAKKKWTQVIENNKLHYVMKDYTTNGFTSRFCYLTTNNLITRGAGKGKNLAEIDISASYECLEFFLSGYAFNQYPIIKGLPTEIAAHYPLLLNRCNASDFMATMHDSQIPWIIFEDIKTKEQHAAPLASVDLTYAGNLFKDDKFDYEKCSFYAASNGLASGANYEEAVIHGALEVLERDAHSYLLIDTFILKKPLRIIDNQSLPNDLVILINQVEENFNNKVIIINMPSRFGVHAYLATFLDREFEFQPRGAGASLDAKHAIERSIYELLQTYNLMHGEYIENKICEEKLKNNALIKDILEFDCGKMITATSPHLIHFRDNSDDTIHVELPDYLTQIMELIDRQSSSLLVNLLHQDKNSLTCVRVMIPSAEEFFLATHYLKLEPKETMGNYIQEQTGCQFSWDHFETLLSE